MLTNIQMFSCSTCTDSFSGACWEVCECALPNMPTGPAHSPRWHYSLSDSLSPCWPDQTALVRTVLTLPTGYNYSVFYCSPSSLSLSLSWVLTLRSRRRAAGPLFCVHCVLNDTHWTVAQNRWGGCWCEKGYRQRKGCYSPGQSLWAAGRIHGRWGGPTYLLLPFSLSIISILSLFFTPHTHPLVPRLQQIVHSRLWLSPSARGGMLLSCPPIGNRRYWVRAKKQNKMMVFIYYNNMFCYIIQKRKRMKKDKYAQFGLFFRTYRVSLYSVLSSWWWSVAVHGSWPEDQHALIPHHLRKERLWFFYFLLFTAK